MPDNEEYDYFSPWNQAVDYFICFGIIVFGLAPVIIGYWHYQ